MRALTADAADRVQIVSEFGACRIENATFMRCFSPRVVGAPAFASSASFSRYTIGLVADGADAMRSANGGDSRRIQLTIVPAPQFAPFKGVRTLTLGAPLVLVGRQLALAASPSEYNVTIGGVACPVAALDENQLVCRTPVDEAPPTTDDAGDELRDGRSLVVVRLGSLRVEIGPLEFADAANLQSTAFVRRYAARLIAGSILSLALLAAGCLLVYALWRRRHSRQERSYKRIAHQLETLESAVRTECLDAFRVLQTDLLDEAAASAATSPSAVGSGLDDGGVPFNERGEFIRRLLFRDNLDASILNSYGSASVYTS